jgi:phage terminase large subunit
VSTKYIPIDLPSVVGKGYATFWHFRGRYRVVKGSRRSKKSKTMALWSIYNIMKHPLSNMLVVRKTYRTLKDSCFTELKWAIKRLQVEHLWQVKESPLEMTYIPTGQKIYFRGLDDPLKITSIAVEVGVLSWMWIEEAYEITKEEDFDTLAESMLGDCPEGLWKQITLTFNPWSDRTWIKKRFFDVSDPDILALTTNYKCNEWLSEADRKEFDRMARNNPRRYRVAGLGDWGVVDGLIYEKYTEQAFTLSQLPKDAQSAFGLDFGYTNDPSALFCGFISLEHRRLYVWDEMYKKGMSNAAIFQEVSRMGYAKEQITGDCAEPKSIDQLKGLGLTRIKGAKKGKDSVNNGIQWIQDLEIIVHPRCVNFLTEISQYQWKKDKFGKPLNEPDGDDHLMDAMRYALERFIQKNKWLI